MEVKIKIIEFSSDVFSKSTQLKNIVISPLFSNTDFSINIFDAISKNDIYKIKVNTPIIKIGLFNGKSLLGIGEININKNTQKIKICSEDKNNNGVAFNKIQDNDYYLTLECKYENINNNKNIKDINKKNKKKKNISVEPNKKSYQGNRVYYKEKMNYNKINTSLINQKKSYKYREDIIKTTIENNNSKEYLNQKNLTSVTNNNNDNDDIFNIKSNSTIIKDNKENILQNAFFSTNNSNHKNKNESEINIFNLSFQKELFSDGVLVLNNDQQTNKDKDKDNNKKKKKKKRKKKTYIKLKI